jgi:hypothetical protein
VIALTPVTCCTACRADEERSQYRRRLLIDSSDENAVLAPSLVIRHRTDVRPLPGVIALSQGELGCLFGLDETT